MRPTWPGWCGGRCARGPHVRRGGEGADLGFRVVRGVDRVVVGGADHPGPPGAGVQFDDLVGAAGAGSDGEDPAAVHGECRRELGPGAGRVDEFSGLGVQYPETGGTPSVHDGDQAAVQRREPPESDLPQRAAELLLARAEGDRPAVRAEAVEVPPAAAVTGVEERAVGRPVGLDDGLRRAPATDRGADSVPSAETSARITSVPSHGIRGWSQASQTACRPSGESRGPVTNRCRPSDSSRTAARSCAADPSSGTATTARRTSVGPSPVNSSMTHQTSPRSGRNCGSTQRSPPPTGERGSTGSVRFRVRSGRGAGRRSLRRRSADLRGA